MFYRQLKDSSLSYLILVICLIAVLYFIIGKASLYLAIPGTNIAPVWPASGLALAAVYLFGTPVSIGILVGSLIINFLSLSKIAPDFSSLKLLTVSFFTSVGAALQAVVATKLIQRYVHRINPFLDAASVGKFIACAISSCLINSTIGTLAATLGGIIPWSSFWLAWRTWFIGDTAGTIVIAPLLIIWVRKPLNYWPPSKILEAIALFIAIEIVSYLNHSKDAQFLYLFLLCIIWAVFRFHLAGTTLSIFLIMIMIVWDATKGIGPYQPSAHNESLLPLALFISVVTGSFLAIAAELENRRDIRRLWHGKPSRLSQWFKNVKAFIAKLLSK